MYPLELCTLHLTERKFVFWNKLRLINHVMCLGTLPHNLQPVTPGRKLDSADPRVVRSCTHNEPLLQARQPPSPPPPLLSRF